MGRLEVHGEGPHHSSKPIQLLHVGEHSKGSRSHRKERAPRLGALWPLLAEQRQRKHNDRFSRCRLGRGAQPRASPFPCALPNTLSSLYELFPVWLVDSALFTLIVLSK